MVRILKIVCLSFLLTSCNNEKKEGNKVLDSKNVTIDYNKKEEKKYFKDIKEFKNLIIGQKWINLDDEDPCHPHSQSVTVENGNIYEYNGVEPSEYKIDTIVQIDSKTLGFRLDTDLNYDVVFTVEVLNFEDKLVKWTINNNSFRSKLYKDICNDYKGERNEFTESHFAKEWKGFYQFSDTEEDADWREGKNYDLYVSVDSVSLKSYGYQHLINRESYAIQKEDTLCIYGQNQDEGLLLKLFVRNNQYVVSSLMDKEGEFKVSKKK